MLITESNYLGLPKSLLVDLEKVAQHTCDSFLTLATKIYAALDKVPNMERYFGDLDYKITASTQKGIQTLKVEDISSGWFAEIVWNTPDDFNPQRLSLFAAEGVSHPHTDKEKEVEHCYGRADIYLDAVNRAQAWTGAFHKLNYQHPLHYQLTQALEEMAE